MQLQIFSSPERRKLARKHRPKFGKQRTVIKKVAVLWPIFSGNIWLVALLLSATKIFIALLLSATQISILILLSD